MSRVSRDRGLSLIEALLAGGLTLLALTLAVQVLIPSLGLVARSSVRTGLQQQARDSLSRIERDLRSSSSFGISVRPVDPVVIAIQPLEQGPFTGAPRWQSELVAYCYLPGSRLLAVKRSGPRPTDRPTTLLQTQLRDLAVSPFDGVLGRNVEEFAVTSTPTGLYTLRLSLAELDPSSRETERLSLTRTVYLRNH